MRRSPILRSLSYIERSWIGLVTLRGTIYTIRLCIGKKRSEEIRRKLSESRKENLLGIRERS